MKSLKKLIRELNYEFLLIQYAVIKKMKSRPWLLVPVLSLVLVILWLVYWSFVFVLMFFLLLLSPVTLVLG